MPAPPEHPDALLTLTDTGRSPLSIRASALVFADPVSRRVRERLEQLAPGRAPVLIQGDMGTGRELLARQLHQSSQREGLFVAINALAISTLHGETELFGHGIRHPQALSSGRTGWFGSAHQGTLYLEDIADLPPALQARLVQVMDSGQLPGQDSARPRAVDVRLVAASSFDLATAVQAGHFSQVLHERLQPGLLCMPPLRERPADILPLACYFLDRYSLRLQIPRPPISPAAAQRLEQYKWPGNIRELENCMHVALLTCTAQSIQPENLPLAG